MQPTELEPYTTIGPDDLLMDAARSLDMTDNLLDLEMNGYTVVPPEKVGSADFRQDLTEAVRSVHARRTQVNRAALEAAEAFGAGELSSYILWEDPIFEKALMNPAAQLLARAMTGHTSRLSLFEGAVKPAGNSSLGLHCDTTFTEPYPLVPQFSNVTYALTDYSEENGSTTFVPGSHKLLRQPVGAEVDGRFGETPGIAGWYGPRIAAPRPVTARAGSIIAWYGTTWHGAVPRKTAGERVSLLMYFCRWYLKTQQNFRDHIPAASLDRWQAFPRFAQTLDKNSGWGFTDATVDAPKGTYGREIYPILDVARP